MFSTTGPLKTSSASTCCCCWSPQCCKGTSTTSTTSTSSTSTKKTTTLKPSAIAASSLPITEKGKEIVKKSLLSLSGAVSAAPDVIMEPRYNNHTSTSRYGLSGYGYSRPHSPPAHNPARSSMPSNVDYSMYGGDIHVMPTSTTTSSSRYSNAPTRTYQTHQHQYTTPASPITTTTYSVSKDPVARTYGSAKRDSSRTRRSTLDSSYSRPPVIVTTMQKPSQATGGGTSSAHQSPAIGSHTSAGRHYSPTQDDFRASDSQFYTQPASSMHTRGHARGNSYTSSHDFANPRSSEGHLTTTSRDPYRPSRSSAAYHSTPRQPPAAVDYGGDGYEYYGPGDLARYDLDNNSHKPRRRRESFDRSQAQYSRPHGTASTETGRGYDHDKPSRGFDNRGGPPTSMRGFDKINRSATPAVYESVPVTHQITDAPPTHQHQHQHVPPSPTEYRSAGDPDAMAVVPSAKESQPSRRRPISVYQESGSKPMHYDDYHRSRDRDEDRGYRPRDSKRSSRDYDNGTYEPSRGGDYYRDEAVTSRGFGIRTDPTARPGSAAPTAADYEDRREPRKESRPVGDGKRSTDEELKYPPPPREEERERRPAREAPREPSRDPIREPIRVERDGERERERERERRPVREPPRDSPREPSRDPVREPIRVERDGERPSREHRSNAAAEDGSLREKFKEKIHDNIGTGLGIAATALGINHVANKNKDDDKEEKDARRPSPPDRDREPRRHSPEKESRPRPPERPSSRQVSPEKDPRRPSPPESRERSWEEPKLREDQRPRDDPRAWEDDRVNRRESDRLRPREKSRERDVAPAVSDARSGGSWDEAETYESEARKRERSTREAESLAGEAPRTSGSKSSTRDPSPARDDQKARRRRPSSGFNPNNTHDLRQLKEQLAAVNAGQDTDKGGKDRERDRDSSGRGPPASEAAARSSRDASPRNYEAAASSGETTLVNNSFESRESRGRELTPPQSEEKHVRVVSPPRDKSDAKPLKGILKKQPKVWPEDENPVREGVAPHKDDKKSKDAPAGARWTKISRKVVNPEALEIGKERFEVRDDFVIVLRVLSKEEIQAYAMATQQLRERRRDEREEASGRDKDRDRERGRDREDEDEKQRHHRSYKRDDDYERYDEDRDRGEKPRRHRRGEEDEEPRYHPSSRHRERERDPQLVEA